VVVEIKDMGGAVNGLFNTGTATITVGDINDNAPTFTKTSVSDEEVTLKKKKERNSILKTKHCLRCFLFDLI